MYNMGTRAAAQATRLMLRCPICLDSVSMPTLTPCGHRFCEPCIRTALGIKLECPTCRRPISSHRALRADSQLAAAAGSELPARSLCAEQGESADDVWTCGSCKRDNPTAAGRCTDCSAWRPALALPRAGPKYVEEEEENLSDPETFGSDVREQIAGGARPHGSLQVGGRTPAQSATSDDEQVRVAADGDERPIARKRSMELLWERLVGDGSQASADCLACAGRHRPHTCARTDGRHRPSDDARERRRKTWEAKREAKLAVLPPQEAAKENW